MPLGHHTYRGPMGLGQYNSLGVCCGPHTASSVFLTLVFHFALYIFSHDSLKHLGNKWDAKITALKVR